MVLVLLVELLLFAEVMVVVRLSLSLSTSTTNIEAFLKRGLPWGRPLFSGFRVLYAIFLSYPCATGIRVWL